MKSYLLDSDILIDFFRRKKEAVHLIGELAMDRADIVISVLSITELRAGWDNDQAEEYLPELYRLARVEQVTDQIAEKAGEIRKGYSRQGKIIHTIDAIIGSTAILHGHWLVTRNTKDYPMTELKIHQGLSSSQ
jgi:predicted nucleic acid-binding protein